MAYIKEKSKKKIDMVFVLALITLFMATNVFPWNALAHDSKVFDLLAQVQFPWRYVGIAIIFLTMLLGFILNQTDVTEYVKFSKSAVIGICAVISVGMTFLFTGYYADNLERNVYYDTANMGTWGVMGEEYLRSNTHIENLDGKIHIDGGTEYAESMIRTGCEMDIACKTGAEEGTVILPVINYKGYQVTDDDGKLYEITDSEEDLIRVELPAGFEGNLYLRFEEPLYWTISFAVSVLSVISLIGVSFVYGWKTKRTVLKEES